MKLPRLPWLGFMVFAALAAPVVTAAEIGVVAWMTGCWVAGDEGEHNEECWLHPGGDMMLGVNRTISKGRTDFEFLRIAPFSDGLAYFASPGGRPPVAFRLVEARHGLAVFSKPEHDFPQRITYSLDGNTLRVRVEALETGEWKGFELVWTRSSWSE